MQIQIAAGLVRVAADKAITHASNQLEEFKGKHKHEALHELIGRARENGYTITDSIRAEMEGMAERDTDNSLERHPANNTIEGLKLIVEMCDYAEYLAALGGNKVAPVVIDHTDFHHLKDFLYKE